MTKEKQIIAIAELDGWTYYPPFKYHQERIEYTHPERWEKDKQERNYVQQFGAYLTSRDAIIPVIEKHTDKWMAFCSALQSIMEPSVYGNSAMDYILVPAKQLAEALLRATNKWHD